jgi:acyl-CoA reductase-like NAD-dependent aldehyde dehydrogenase
MIVADFADRLTTRMTGLKVGRGTGRSVHVSPLLAAKARENMITFVAEIRAWIADWNSGPRPAPSAARAVAKL